MRSWHRYLVWLATIPLAFVFFFWVPWPSDWLEMGTLLVVLAVLFLMDELTR